MAAKNQNLITPNQAWVNEDRSPHRDFYKMISRLPGLRAPSPVITGSRGGNAALTSLIKQLAFLDIIDDQTTP